MFTQKCTISPTSQLSCRMSCTFRVRPSGTFHFIVQIYLNNEEIAVVNHILHLPRHIIDDVSKLVSPSGYICLLQSPNPQLLSTNCQIVSLALHNRLRRMKLNQNNPNCITAKHYRTLTPSSLFSTAAHGKTKRQSPHHDNMVIVSFSSKPEIATTICKSEVTMSKFGLEKGNRKRP